MGSMHLTGDYASKSCYISLANYLNYILMKKNVKSNNRKINSVMGETVAMFSLQHLRNIHPFQR